MDTSRARRAPRTTLTVQLSRKEKKEEKRRTRRPDRDCSRTPTNIRDTGSAVWSTGLPTKTHLRRLWPHIFVHQPPRLSVLLCGTVGALPPARTIAGRCTCTRIIPCGISPALTVHVPYLKVAGDRKKIAAASTTTGTESALVPCCILKPGESPEKVCCAILQNLQRSSNMFQRNPHARTVSAATRSAAPPCSRSTPTARVHPREGALAMNAIQIDDERRRGAPLHPLVLYGGAPGECGPTDQGQRFPRVVRRGPWK
jgi:hypothetical protein